MNYPTRSLILASDYQRKQAQAILANAPDGIEVIFREPVKKRRSEQNSYAWAGVLADFAEQGWVQGRQFSQQAWHEHLKTEYLPETPVEGITLDGYVKWVELPNGERKMVGSTTKLTVKGFAQYLDQCMAFGAQELGIRFSTMRDAA